MEVKLGMDRMHNIKTIHFEGVGDSELLNPAVAPLIDAQDDAKSTSGRVHSDDDASSCSSSRKINCNCSCRRRKKARDRGKNEDRQISWRSWLIEYSARCDAIDRPCRDADADETDSAAGVGEAERNRLFWETCLAHGY